MSHSSLSIYIHYMYDNFRAHHCKEQIYIFLNICQQNWCHYTRNDLRQQQQTYSLESDDGGKFSISNKSQLLIRHLNETMWEIFLFPPATICNLRSRKYYTAAYLNWNFRACWKIVVQQFTNFDFASPTSKSFSTFKSVQDCFLSSLLERNDEKL